MFVSIRQTDQKHFFVEKIIFNWLNEVKKSNLTREPHNLPPDFLKRLKQADSSLRVMMGTAIRSGVYCFSFFEKEFL